MGLRIVPLLVLCACLPDHLAFLPCSLGFLFTLSILGVKIHAGINPWESSVWWQELEPSIHYYLYPSVPGKRLSSHVRRQSRAGNYVKAQDTQGCLSVTLSQDTSSHHWHFHVCILCSVSLHQLILLVVCDTGCWWGMWGLVLSQLTSWDKWWY